jgi:endo-1,4-beta-mannosidase
MPPLLNVNGRPTFILGVNYWSRAGGPRMWERFDERVVKEELAQMRRIGLNVLRGFAFIPSFMPRPPAVEGAALALLDRFLALAEESEVGVIPSVLVGHMSGENYDFPGQRGRCLYEDSELLEWQHALSRAVAATGSRHSSVIAYLASNEMPLWGGRAEPPVIAAWARGLRHAIRDEDRARPFSLGDGVMNLKGGQNGFDVKSLQGIIDFVGPHTYYADTDSLRQALNAEWCIRSLTHLGVPVLFEEFGCSSSQASEENQALYYREVMHSCLSTGAAGALGWCFSDLDLAFDPPYSHHAFELGFGITRADGSEKPVCNELRAFADLLGTVDAATFKAPECGAAIIVPSYFHTAYPFSWEDRERTRRSLLQAYALCVGAGIEAELVPEGSDLGSYRLVLIPSTQKLLATTWRDLLGHVRRGGIVYWSYFSGDYGFQQSAWCQLFAELTGLRHGLRYGCFDLPEATARLDGEAEASGLHLLFPTAPGEKPYPRSFLPVEPNSAKVLARDGRGSPALTSLVHRGGAFLFLNCPIEHYLAEEPEANAKYPAFELYAFLARQAKLEPKVASSEPFVQTRIVASPAGDLLWVMNHGWVPRTVRIESPGGDPIYGIGHPLDVGSSNIDLGPKQICIFRLQHT